MPDIPNYSLNVPNPSEQILSGIQTGMGLQDIVAKRQQAQEAMVRQQQIGNAMAELNANPNPTVQDYTRVASMLPKEQADSLRSNWEALSKENQRNRLKYAGQVLAAFDASPEIAIKIMNERSEAERNAGNEKEAQENERWTEIAKENPELVKRTMGIMIASLPGGKDILDSVSKFGKGEGKTAGLEDPVKSSSILEDGTVQIVRTSGKVEVVSPKAAEQQLIKQAREYGAQIQGLRAGERGAGTEAIKQSIEAFKQLRPVKENIVNINEGIRLIDEGAETGVITSRFPSIRSASIALDNLQGKLGLDVLRTTTFGALSEKELSFALDTALPKKLSPPELKKWLQNKGEAQRKLASYLEEAAIYLGTPGNTVADFLSMKKEQKKAAKKETPKTTQTTGGPQVGMVEDGYRFKGGNPSDPNNWEPI